MDNKELNKLFPKNDCFIRLPWFAFRIWWPQKVMGSYRFNNAFGLTFWKNNYERGWTIKFFKSYEDLLFSERNKCDKDTKYYKYCLIAPPTIKPLLKVSYRDMV